MRFYLVSLDWFMYLPIKQFFLTATIYFLLKKNKKKCRRHPNYPFYFERSTSGVHVNLTVCILETSHREQFHECVSSIMIQVSVTGRASRSHTDTAQSVLPSRVTGAWTETRADEPAGTGHRTRNFSLYATLLYWCWATSVIQRQTSQEIGQINTAMKGSITTKLKIFRAKVNKR